MPTQSSTIQGLIRILSAERFPNQPNLRGPKAIQDLEKWIREMYDFLRKIFGKFSAENIITTISQGGGTFAGAVSKIYHFKGTDASIDVDVDDTIDWRLYGLLIHARVADTLSHLQIATDDPDDVTILKPGSNKTLDYGFNVLTFNETQYGTNLSAIIGITVAGKLQLQITNSSGGHTEGYISLYAAAYGGVGSDSVLIGNGL